LVAGAALPWLGRRTRQAGRPALQVYGVPDWWQGLFASHAGFGFAGIGNLLRLRRTSGLMVGQAPPAWARGKADGLNPLPPHFAGICAMIAIVDYNAGNLKSVESACRHVGMPAEITQDADRVARADRIIFPGVGAAHSAMATLNRTGLADALRAAFAKGTPILGICLGCQVVLGHSEEGDVDTLGLAPGRVRRFRLADKALKIPHMGWNAIEIRRPHPILDRLENGYEFYFVHSFHPCDVPEENICAVTEYEITFPSAIAHGNLFATQFHPEKSGRFGLTLLENFMRWKP